VPEKQNIPYGLWPSTISPAALGLRPRLEDVQFDSDGETLVWLEKRSGQGVLVSRRRGDAPRDLTVGIKVGAGVGYGGGDFTVRNGTLVFVSGGRLYRMPVAGGSPQPVTPAFGDCATPMLSPDGSKILYVHSYERTDCLALVDVQGSNFPVRVAQGADFYMQPVWHPNGQYIAWVEWDHPQMPWDGTRLMTARLEGTGLVEVRCLAGDADTPIFQPEFSPDGRWLSFLAQDGEWDQLHVIDLTNGKRRSLVGEAVLMTAAWAQGLRTYAWSSDSAGLFYLRSDQGISSLWAAGLDSKSSDRLDISPYTWLEQIAAGAENNLAFIASSPQTPERIISLKDGSINVERYAEPGPIEPEDLPVCQPISWQGPDGTAVHGLYFSPASRRFASDGLPPAIVHIHGGPTSMAAAKFNTDAAFFTTRGYGFLEVNYRGSTGYGRSYMLALRQKWGLLDVEDAVGGAQALGSLGLADPQRLVIMGASAGGYTVLNVLVRHAGVFKAGVCLYGLSNLFISETHKFEERYNDSLIGLLPQDAERFRAWSPVYFADQIKDPVAVFQGAEDKVVPPEHSEQIVSALRTNHIPHIYKVYEGEGHGWRKTETITDFYNTVDKFLQQHVLFA
jgi:dipeptidyl aminopeptidase/acylaminoacyl peptidase